jgi:hypothetical protein
VERDPATDQVLRQRKKLRGNMLQRGYQAFADQFGFTKRQVMEAMYRLEKTYDFMRKALRHLDTPYGRIELATALAQHPTASLPEACGDGARFKGAYRFLSNDAGAPPDLLHSHIEATDGRLAQVPLVLAVQDTTEIDGTSHPATQGVAPLGHRACQGLPVHSPLAVTPERVPLRLLAQQG